MQTLPALRPPGTTRIVLHGRLRRQFGSDFDWGCPTPAHAIYALMTMKPGFRQELARGAYRIVRGPRETGMDLDGEMLRLRVPPGGEIHIIPMAWGAGGGNSMGIIKIVLGVVMIGLAIATAGGVFSGIAGIGATSGTGGGVAGALGLGNTLFGVQAGAMGLFGFGLLLSGVGSILSHQQQPAQNASFTLSGPTNTSAQGGPVPVAYGFIVLVGSVIISSSYEAQQMQTNNSKNGSTDGGNGNPF